MEGGILLVRIISTCLYGAERRGGAPCDIYGTVQQLSNGEPEKVYFVEYNLKMYSYVCVVRWEVRGGGDLENIALGHSVTS